MKIDFKKTLDSYQARQGTFRILEIPKMQYLMIDGHGDPNSSQEFSDAIEALYPMAYKLKFASKNELKKDYVVPPLEGLWWAEDMEKFTSRRDKSAWSWTLLLFTPDWINAEMFEAVKKTVAEKTNPKILNQVRLESLEEGTCIQTLHIGSFDDEGPTLETMHHKFIPDNGYKLAKKHHEIYFSDFRKVPPSNYRTILRQPVINID